MKRKLSLILCLLTLAQLAACGGEGGTPETSADTTPAETAPPYADNLGDIRFDGKTFTFYLCTGYGDYYVEEESGEVLNDAIYNRNRKVEERLGITLNYVNGDVGGDGTSQGVETQTIRSLIQAGDTENHVYVHSQHSGMPAMINEKYFIDWNTIPNLDLTQDYWYQNCIRDINYGNKIYAMTGVYNLGTLTSANCLYFNKRLMTELGHDYPYQAVLDMKWTNDKFVAMIKDATQDLNGDGKIEFDKDQTGFHGWSYEQNPAYFMGLGGDICTKDKDNMPVLQIDTERNVNIVDTILKTFELDGAAFESKTYGIFNDEFIDGRLLFVHGHLSLSSKFRDMPDDFGFLPYPMLDEEQGEYHSRVQNTSGLTYIPVTNDDLEFTGAVLEVLASTSSTTTVPAYFDVVLTVKQTRDTESEQMIPIIRESCSFYDEALGFSMNTVISSGKNLVTYYAEQKNTVEKNLQDLIDTYKD